MAYGSFADLLTAARAHGSLGRAVLLLEAEESDLQPEAIEARMAETIGVMRAAVEHGLSGEARSRTGLTGGDAALVSVSSTGPVGGVFTQAIAAALATGEVNAAMGRIVAAPTGGASGVVPAALLTTAEERGADDSALAYALFAAAGVGGVVAARATLSGAVGGCQAEVGSAAAMAAAGVVELCGGSPEQAGNGAALAMQGLLGLVCDPIAGLVEVPCVARNATGVAVALAAAEMALAGVEFPVPFDEVVDAQAQVGRSLPPSLRETALGGLAVTPTGKSCASRLLSSPGSGTFSEVEGE